MTFSVPAEFVSFVESSVAAGKYPSSEAMVAAGLELLRERQEYDEYVRREVQIGIDELERGEGRTFKSVEELREFFQELKQRNRADLEADTRTAS